MTSTSAFTWTSAVARTDLLYAEISIALLNAGVATVQQVEKYQDPGLKQRWINAFLVYGFDAEGLARAELSLKISWALHDAYLAEGKLKVFAHPTWTEDALPELEVLEGLFLDTVNAQSLKKELRLRLAPLVYFTPILKARVYGELGLSDGAPIQWAGEPEGKTRVTRQLPELEVGLRAAFNTGSAPSIQRATKPTLWDGAGRSSDIDKLPTSRTPSPTSEGVFDINKLRRKRIPRE